MDWKLFMSPDAASRISKLESSDIATIVTLTSMSQKVEDILRIAQQIHKGDAPKVPNEVLSTQPKPIHIMAHSFVRDKNQYNGVYGLSDEKAAELTTLLRKDPEAAGWVIKTIVKGKLEAKNSERDVQVILPESTQQSSAPSATTSLVGDGGAKELSAEVAKSPSVYGQYQFEPEPTGLAGQYQYGVHLGDDLFAIGQSKKVVVAAARLCRVKGRFHEVVKPYIWYWTSWSSAVRGDDIPDDCWDGKQSAFAAIKPRKSKDKDALSERKRPFEMIAEDVD